MTFDPVTGLGHRAHFREIQKTFLSSRGEGGVGWRGRKRDENGVEQENEQR